MNRDEEKALKYLHSLTHDIIFEPDGNIPPDFLINHNTAVEVRRLNQQYRTGITVVGLEEHSIPLLTAIKNELKNYPCTDEHQSYWLSISFKRATGKIKNIKKNLLLAISAFETQNENIPFSYNLSENVTLDFLGSRSKKDQKYKIGVEDDQDNGGWIIHTYTEEIDHCIQEKKKKITPYRCRYKIWWLILVDHIYLADADDYKEIQQDIVKPECFEKVIVVDTGGQKVIEV